MSFQPHQASCAECGKTFVRSVARARFCSDRCRYRHRDRLKYAADPEGESAKARSYYATHREAVIARVKRYQAAKGGKLSLPRFA